MISALGKLVDQAACKSASVAIDINREAVKLADGF